LLGLVANIGGGLIHLLLVVALVIFVINLLTGRRTVKPRARLSYKYELRTKSTVASRLQALRTAFRRRCAARVTPDALLSYYLAVSPKENSYGKA
jgi:hypothetical protein